MLVLIIQYAQVQKVVDFESMFNRRDHCLLVTILLSKAKRQYLLPCKVSRYLLLFAGLFSWSCKYYDHSRYGSILTFSLPYMTEISVVIRQ